MDNELKNLEDLRVPQTCPAMGYQELSVCVPVTVTPFAKTGKTKTTCCGSAVVDADDICPGTENGSCTFTITQDICVSVPVTFGAHASAGNPFVNCGDASAEDICKDCDKDGDM